MTGAGASAITKGTIRSALRHLLMTTMASADFSQFVVTTRSLAMLQPRRL